MVSLISRMKRLPTLCLIDVPCRPARRCLPAHFSRPARRCRDLARWVRARSAASSRLDCRSHDPPPAVIAPRVVISTVVKLHLHDRPFREQAGLAEAGGSHHKHQRLGSRLQPPQQRSPLHPRPGGPGHRGRLALDRHAASGLDGTAPGHGTLPGHLTCLCRCGIVLMACDYADAPAVLPAVTPWGQSSPLGGDLASPGKGALPAGREEFQQPGRNRRCWTRDDALPLAPVPGSGMPAGGVARRTVCERRGRVREGATRCRSQQAEQAGPLDGLGARGDPQFGVDALQVRLDRVHRHQAFACDLGVGQAGGQEPQHR